MTQSRIPRVLIVDDERHIRLLMKTILRAMKWQEVAEAANGVEAVERCAITASKPYSRA